MYKNVLLFFFLLVPVEMFAMRLASEVVSSADLRAAQASLDLAAREFELAKKSGIAMLPGGIYRACSDKPLAEGIVERTSVEFFRNKGVAREAITLLEGGIPTSRRESPIGEMTTANGRQLHARIMRFFDKM